MATKALHDGKTEGSQLTTIATTAGFIFLFFSLLTRWSYPSYCIALQSSQGHAIHDTSELHVDLRGYQLSFLMPPSARIRQPSCRVCD